MSNINIFETELTKLKFVGEKTAGLLNKLGVTTVRDLLYHFPRKYLDFSKIKRICDLKVGEDVTVAGTVVGTRVTNKPKNSLVISAIKDDSGHISAVWFNQRYLAKTLTEGTQVILSGKVLFKYGRLQVENPFYEVISDNKKTDNYIHTGRIIPFYPSTSGLTTRHIRSIINRLLKEIKIQDDVKAYAPAGFMTLEQAIKRAHFPGDLRDLVKARKRLVWEELFANQMMLFYRKRYRKSVAGIAHRSGSKTISDITAKLPFELTGGQAKAANEIVDDMSAPYRMERLLQGDVGSGKTAVAMIAMAYANSCGKQAALMAPTEILAMQHYLKYKDFFKTLGFNFGLLAGGAPLSEKNIIKNDIALGLIDSVVGTHSLIQEQVAFKNISLVIIDEQHRFGVTQRKALQMKGEKPDVLTMSATPIPRTLSMVRFGDLDISNIKAGPHGMKDIITELKGSEDIPEIAARVKNEVSAGSQAFIVCPLIDADNKNVSSVKTEVVRWRKLLYPYRIQEMHGKTKNEEKEEIMDNFAKGFIDVLISTTLIEVGIDVPNANLMVVNNAERFGLAQLHQLRGRVGRGPVGASCILIYDGPPGDDTSYQRLSSLLNNSDGFSLSEIDMNLRGTGEAFGTRQWGKNGLKLAKFPKHANILSRINDHIYKNGDELVYDNNLKKAIGTRFKQAKGRKVT